MARLTTIRPSPFPAAVRTRLLEVLADEHAADPFGPADVRTAARRVVAAVGAVGLDATIHRGGVDLGGVELDHVFVVVQDRVVDLALPVVDERFVAAARAWVAGDVELGALTTAAADAGIEHRVVGEYPARFAYRGAPLWGAAA